MPSTICTQGSDETRAERPSQYDIVTAFLVEFEVLYSDCGEHDTDRRELDDEGIRFSIVHLMHLTAALGD